MIVRDAPTNPLRALTEAQLGVLHWIAEGLPNPEIAERLSVCEQTVKFHARDIYRRLGVRNRVEAAVTYHIWCAS